MKPPILYLFFLQLLFGFVAVDAQVSNTQADFSCPGQVTVTYDLITSEPVDATLYYSPDKCIWLIPEHVSGDLLNQTTGTGKTIVWDNYADNARYGKFYFKVEIPQPDCEGVMINGVCWATSNLDVNGVFCANPEDYGALYQWGRLTDGHESRTSGITTTLSTTDNPGHSNFIVTPGAVSPSDWRTPPNDNLWNSGTETNPIKTVNDPCPVGWRVPTRTELETLGVPLSNQTLVTKEWKTDYPISGVNGYLLTDKATGNTLFFPAAGYRDYPNGGLFADGTYGYYWSSTSMTSNQTNSTAAVLRSQSGSFNTNNNSRAYGLPVRCVAEN